jgi:hypothetical protein
MSHHQPRFCGHAPEARHRHSFASLEHLEQRRLLAVIGFYDIKLGEGDEAGALNQRSVIEAAGHTAVRLDSLSVAELSSVDMLALRHYGATSTVYQVTLSAERGETDALEFINALPLIHTAVSDGMVLLMEDMLPHTTLTMGPGLVLPGASGVSFASSILAGVPKGDVNFITTDTLVSEGPAGALTDTSLDSATVNVFEGHAIGSTLPLGTEVILKSASGDVVTTFSYTYGSGRVVFSGMTQRSRIGGLPEPLGSNLLIYEKNLTAYAASFAITNTPPEWTVAPDTEVQFSDDLVMVFTAEDDDNDLLSAELVSGLPEDCGVTFTWDDQTNTGTLSGTAQLDPGEYILTLRISDGEEFSDRVVTLTVTPEDAHAGYSGLHYFATPSLSDNTAQVMLRATVLDISGMPGSGDDTAASLGGATVTFRNVTTGTVIAGIPIVPMTEGDSTVGVASASYLASLASEEDSLAHVWTIEVHGTHAFSGAATVITVSRPDDGRVAGGGAIINGQSAGVLATVPGSTTEFSLNARRHRQTGALNGSIGLIITSYQLPDGSLSPTLRLYSIQSTQIVSLDTLTLNDERRAFVAADVTVWDITDALNPVSVQTGLRLEMTVAAGNRGVGRAGFTIWGSGGGQSTLWFSNDWDTTNTLEQMLSEGNINVLF